MRAQLTRLIAVVALAAGSIVVTSALPAGAHDGKETKPKHNATQKIEFQLAPSTPAIAACLPKLRAEVEVDLQTDQKGRDEFTISASGLPPRTDFTVFLLEVPGSPFGAAEYIGDFTTNDSGGGHNEFKLIVAEAFSSTLVNGARVRAELNHVGFWFADPAGDDVCFGQGTGPVTPFDGDNQAGAQVMNSANFLPGFPLPLP